MRSLDSCAQYIELMVEPQCRGVFECKISTVIHHPGRGMNGMGLNRHFVVFRASADVQ